MKPFSLGFSPCPNDTFIFYALIHDLISSPASFLPPQLEDVETLNNWAMTTKLDVTKLSFHALGHVLDDYCILSSGSALGRGCGPLLVAGKEFDITGQKRIAVPGKYTTAALLFRMFAPQAANIIEMRFDQIIPSICKGDVDGGVIIHESRFTYSEHGLTCLQDLGQWWEETSGQPIPLGCIAAKRNLGQETVKAIDEAIRKSLEYAYQYPEECLPYIRAHSQEIEEKVIQEHIGLYVNDFSLQLGDEGMLAIETFLQRGRKAGVLPESNQKIKI